MKSDPDIIPTIEVYRGVPLHDRQSPGRLAVVRAAIDSVYEIADPAALFAYAADPANPPEARLLAAARCEAGWQIAAEKREARPDVDLVKLRAYVAGLDSVKWRDPFAFTTLLDPRPAVAREEPLADDD